MQTDLEKIMLEAARCYLQTLNDEQFLAISCDLSKLHDGIIRIVHNQSLRRNYRAPNNVTAGVFDRRKDTIKKILRKM